MQAEWLLALTCAGYIAPSVWDRYLRSALNGLLISDGELRTRQLVWNTPNILTDINRLHEANAEIDQAVARVQAAVNSRHIQAIEQSVNNAIANSGARTMILPNTPTRYNHLYDEHYQPHCGTCEDMERHANRRIEYCMGDIPSRIEFGKWPAGSY